MGVAAGICDWACGADGATVEYFQLSYRKSAGIALKQLGTLLLLYHVVQRINAGKACEYKIGTSVFQVLS